MEAHVIPLHQAIRLEGDRIVIERLSLSDPTLAAFLGERPAGDRGPLVERALRIGLIALQDAGVTVNVDAVLFWTVFARVARIAPTVLLLATVRRLFRRRIDARPGAWLVALALFWVAFYAYYFQRMRGE